MKIRDQVLHRWGWCSRSNMPYEHQPGDSFQLSYDRGYSVPDPFDERYTFIFSVFLSFKQSKRQR